MPAIKHTTIAISGLLTFGLLGAQDVKPIASSKNTPLSTTETIEVSPETLAILKGNEHRRAVALEAALVLKSDAEAQKVIDSVLAETNAAAIISESKARARIRVEETGRTAESRLESIEFLKRRLKGEATLAEAPESFRSRVVVTAPPAAPAAEIVSAQPRFYENNQRVVTYRTMSEVPGVLVASSRFNRVKIQQVGLSPYVDTFGKMERRPSEYVSPEAYAVTYTVDPKSEVTRDDILFVQGSTAFADAYSYDLVVDLALAMNDPALAGESFVVEGHSSAEGSFDENLTLSQRRAERIVREMASFGVSTSRLVPVGVGESEAEYPASAPEELRATNRRVVVFRLQ